MYRNCACLPVHVRINCFKLKIKATDSRNQTVFIFSVHPWPKLNDTVSEGLGSKRFSYKYTKQTEQILSDPSGLVGNSDLNLHHGQQYR